MGDRGDNEKQVWRGVIKDIGPTVVAVAAIVVTFLTTSQSLEQQSRLSAIQSAETIRREAYAEFIGSLNGPVELWASGAATDSSVALANRRLLTSFYRLEPLIADAALRDKVWDLLGKYILDVDSLEQHHEQGDEALMKRLKLIGAAQDTFRAVLLAQLFNLEP